MRYETERKIIDGMNKLFNAESEDIIQKNTCFWYRKAYNSI